MADKTLAERLQPSLLDRLTDDHRDKRSESREDRVIDVRRLRDIIQRDLSWLLNANNGETLIDGDIYPNVRRSVLNYGVREASGAVRARLVGIEQAGRMRRGRVEFERERNIVWQERDRLQNFIGFVGAVNRGRDRASRRDRAVLARQRAGDVDIGRWHRAQRRLGQGEEVIGRQRERRGF